MSFEAGVLRWGFAVVATEGDEGGRRLLAGVALGRAAWGDFTYRARAWRECPHLRIEIWGTPAPRSLVELDMGHHSSIEPRI